MTILGLSEGVFRFSLFAGIFLAMSLLETLLPRRERRYPRGQRWWTNFGVLASSFLAVSVVTFVIPITAALAAVWAEAEGWGLFRLLELPVWIEWIIAFLVLDFVIWAQHVVTHKVPVLWRVHRVHHTDEDIDATTAIRFHPVEIVLSIFVKAAAVVLLGPPVVLVVIFEAFVNGSAMFNHANLRLPDRVDRWLRLFVVTPDMHRVHHSADNSETDSNFGFALSIWDRIFRTYTAQPKLGHVGMTIGLAEWQDEAPTRFWWSLGLPFTNPPRSSRKAGAGTAATESATDQ